MEMLDLIGMVWNWTSTSVCKLYEQGFWMCVCVFEFEIRATTKSELYKIKNRRKHLSIMLPEELCPIGVKD